MLVHNVCLVPSEVPGSVLSAALSQSEGWVRKGCCKVSPKTFLPKGEGILFPQPFLAVLHPLTAFTHSTGISPDNQQLFFWWPSMDQCLDGVSQEMSRGERIPPRGLLLVMQV